MAFLYKQKLRITMSYIIITLISEKSSIFPIETSNCHWTVSDLHRDTAVDQKSVSFRSNSSLLFSNQHTN